MSVAAKLIVVGMVSNGFTIADPDDAGMFEVVGFDTATSRRISDFTRSGSRRLFPAQVERATGQVKETRGGGGPNAGR